MEKRQLGKQGLEVSNTIPSTELYLVVTKHDRTTYNKTACNAGG